MTQSDQAIAVQRVRAAADARNFHEAIALCNEGLQLNLDDDSANYRLYNNQAASHQRSGQYIPISADFSMASRLCPSSWLPVHNRCAVYKDIGATQAAPQVTVLPTSASATQAV